MLDIGRITELARDVFRRKLGPKRVEDVVVEPRADSLGNDALLVLVVISPSALKQLKNGEDVATARFEFGQQLELAGEDRFPIVEYATREELLADSDAES
jgi:hypothetical protein